MIIGRNELIDEVAEKTGHTQRDVTTILNSVLATILTRLLHAGDTVSIHNFGRFFIGDVAAREGRDPRTGEPISIPARRRIRFQASKTIRDELTTDAKRTVAVKPAKVVASAPDKIGASIDAIDAMRKRRKR